MRDAEQGQAGLIRADASRGAAVRALLAASLVLGLMTMLPQPASAESLSVFTIGNYPVEASAEDAVTAKSKAMSEGQAGAFRYLLKRLVPVTAYQRIPRLGPAEIEDMIDGVSVRGEQNSATEYLATLEFSFKDRAIRQLLKTYNLPFLDRQSGTVTVMPVFFDRGAIDAPTKAMAAGQQDWRRAWTGLDLAHALTPIKLVMPGPGAAPKLFARLAAGDRSGLGVIETEAAADRLVVALAERSPEDGKLKVLLIGRDWVGDINLRRSYSISEDDVGYATEYAAVIALGVLEGRWKADRLGQGEGGGGGYDADAGWAGGEEVHLVARFSGLKQWQALRARLASVVGPDAVSVGTLSARSAEVTVRYDGGAEALASALAARGLALAQTDAGLVLSAD